MTEIGREIVGSNETSLNRIRLVATVIGQLIGAEGFSDKIEEKAMDMDEFALGALYASLGQVRRVLIESSAPHRTLEVVSAVEEPDVDPEPLAKKEIDDVRDVSAPQIGEIIELGSQESLDVAVETTVATELAIEAEAGGLAKKPLKYLYEYFDSSYVDRLTMEHAKPLAEAIANEFYRRFTTTRRPKEALITELEGYFKGLNNDELANLNFMTEASVQVMRSRVFTKLKSVLHQEGVDKLIASIFKLDTASPLTDKTDEAAAQSSIENSPADDNAAGPEVMPEAQQATSISLGEYLEVDQEDTEDEHDTFESVIGLASQYWSADDIASLKELLDLTSGEADIALARQHISDLMEKYLNYWGKDRANVPKYQWDLLNKLCDYQLTRKDGNAVTYRIAEMMYRGPAGTKGLTVEQAFANIFMYLVEAEIRDFARDYVPSVASREPEAKPASIELALPEPAPVNKVEAEAQPENISEVLAALRQHEKHWHIFKGDETKVLEKHLTGKGDTEYSHDDVLDAVSSLRTLVLEADKKVTRFRQSHPQAHHAQLNAKQRALIDLFAGNWQIGRQPIAYKDLKQYYAQQPKNRLKTLPEIKEVPEYLESALHTLFSMMRLH